MKRLFSKNLTSSPASSASSPASSASSAPSACLIDQMLKINPSSASPASSAPSAYPTNQSTN